MCTGILSLTLSHWSRSDCGRYCTVKDQTKKHFSQRFHSLSTAGTYSTQGAYDHKWN